MLSLEQMWDATIVFRENVKAWNTQWKARTGEDYGSPFSNLDSKLWHEVRDIRKSIIEDQFHELAKKLCPNLDVEKDFPDFNNLMDLNAGEGEFKQNVIKRWFEDFMTDEEDVRNVSLKRIITRASGLRTRREKVDEFVDKKGVMTLRAYTWHTGYSKPYIGTSGWPQEAQALSRLIEIMLYKSDPITATGDSLGIYEHSRLSGEPEYFYKRVKTLRNKAVEYFQFYKNGKLVIKFTSSTLAYLVGKKIEYEGEHL